MSATQMSPDELAKAAQAYLEQMKEQEKEEFADLLSAPSSAHGTPVPQRTGTEKVYDKTQLHMLAGLNLLRIHRDYLAHAIRYEFLLPRIKKSGSDAMVLDIGCGDVPLMRAMRSSMLRPKFYLGIDVRKREIDKVNAYYADHQVHFPFRCMYLDFTEADTALLQLKWTQVVCLEVIEHMPRGRGQILLANLKQALGQGGTGYLSTPCYDGKRKAKHHHYEWGQGELEDELIKSGFKIENCYGTFGNVHDLKRVLTPEEKVVWDNLAESNGGYYGSIALSLIFSPLHPEAARNCIWEITV